MQGQEWWVVLAAGGMAGALVTQVFGWVRDHLHGRSERRDLARQEDAKLALFIRREFIKALKLIERVDRDIAEDDDQAWLGMAVTVAAVLEETAENVLRVRHAKAREHLETLTELTAGWPLQTVPSHVVASSLAAGLDAVVGALVREEDVPRELPPRTIELKRSYDEMMEQAGRANAAKAARVRVQVGHESVEEASASESKEEREA